MCRAIPTAVERFVSRAPQGEGVVKARNELESDEAKKMARSIPKHEVRRLLETLPEEASYEDIQYHIYVQQKIDRGLEASERGDFISDEEIEQRIARWAGE
jgi:predicted transcriptional regulator